MMFSMDIEDFKSRLFLDVVSEEQKAALEGLGVPYQSKGSFVLVPRLLLDKDMSAVVTHEMLLDIGMDMDTLFEECKINSTKMYPGKVVGLSEYLSKEEMEIEPDGIAMPQVYVLTNATGANGAAAFFYQPIPGGKYGDGADGRTCHGKKQPDIAASRCVKQCFRLSVTACRF